MIFENIYGDSDVGNFMMVTFSSPTSTSPLFTYTISTSGPQNELVIFDVNISARNTVFEISETAWNRRCEGIIVNEPRFTDRLTYPLGPKLISKTTLGAALRDYPFYSVLAVEEVCSRVQNPFLFWISNNEN